jgi:hypothetical protein
MKMDIVTDMETKVDMDMDMDIQNLDVGYQLQV